jgi:hypothetical protein
MGEGPLLGQSAWREAGRLAYGQTDEAKAQTGELRKHAERSHPLRSGRPALPDPRCLCFAYIPACHTAQWNKQSDKSSGGRMRRRPPLASNEAQNRCGPTATAHRKPCRHAHGQQRQYAPAYPQQRSTQMSGSRERHTQTTADREIGGNAHGTLRHQRKRNAGQSPRRRAARSPRDLPLLRWWNGRGSIPPARANQSLIGRSCHACASSWQRDKAAGLSSY